MSSTRNKYLVIIAVIFIAACVTIWGLNRPDHSDQPSDGIDEISVSEESQQGNEQVEASSDDDGDKAAPTDKPLQPSIQQDIPSVAEVYADYFPIGAAIEPNQTEGLVAELLKKHVNMIVAENAMKPSSLQPSEGNFNWGPADRLVKFAKENGMELRFHTLVWHNQVPGWFFVDADGKKMVDETDSARREANKKLLLERLDTHVRTIVERYKDDIKWWDVVNEVIEPGDPDGIRNSEWYKITGTDFIETAFRAARDAGGLDIKLYINDYGTDDPVKSRIMYDLVAAMLDKGVPIDGVGHQTHISVAWPPAIRIIESMKKFAELGLDNQITELDMSLYAWNDRSNYGADIPEKVLNKQGEIYRDLFEALKEQKDIISGVVFWGIADNHTWLSGFPITRTEGPLLFDKQMQAKPAYWGVVDPSKLQ